MPKGIPFDKATWEAREQKKAAQKADRVARPNQPVTNKMLAETVGD